jgi:3-hydroxyisobutyrate dehydrogenase-like beta-hydroxyacid dehydrogenase
MTDVSVIGLGSMGSALASSLLDKGYSVTVWNRTAEKAQPLIASGAELAETPDGVVTASPVVVVCVDNYEISRSILETASAELAGRTLIQLTSDTATSAVDLERWVTEHGASYLDGVILAYPSDVGSPDAAIAVAGESAAWNDVESILCDLAGATAYVGENVRVPSTLSAALISPLLGLLVGAIQGAVMCEAEDFPVAAYADMTQSASVLLMGQMHHLLSTIAEGRFDEPEAALKTYASSVTDRTADMRQRRVNTEFYGFVDDLLQRSIDAGFGDEELSAIVKLWR